MRLESKVAIITGAGSGVGRASAMVFAREGAKVVVVDIVAANGEETASMVKAGGGDAVFVEADVTKSADCEKMVQTAVTTYGKVDIMFNNAGFLGPTKLIHDLSEEDWSGLIALNVTGVFLGTKYAVQEMLKTGGGVIINTASVAAMIPQRAGGLYATSKAAVIGLTKATAIDYARKNIRANCLLPGPIDTAFWEPVAGGDPVRKEKFREQVMAREPIGRFAQPEEIASAALFLASDDSSFATGSSLVVDGGQILV
jgi:NAD(P)-dependent dehydrogenase (short-subunit alcohol dehydrogenase family)